MPGHKASIFVIGHVLRKSWVVTPAWFEHAARSLGNCCSIHLSYGAILVKNYEGAMGNCQTIAALQPMGELPYGATN